MYKKFFMKHWKICAAIIGASAIISVATNANDSKNNESQVVASIETIVESEEIISSSLEEVIEETFIEEETTSISVETEIETPIIEETENIFIEVSSVISNDTIVESALVQIVEESVPVSVPIIESTPISAPKPAVEVTPVHHPEYNFNTYHNEHQQQTTAFVLNTNSMKVHHASCRSVPKIAPQNYGTSNDSIDVIIAQGYSYCGICFK